MSEQGKQVEAGAELDAMVAEKLFGWPSLRKWNPGECFEDAKRIAREAGVDVVCWWEVDGSSWHPWHPFSEWSVPTPYRFSTDIEAAWSVVEKMIANGRDFAMCYEEKSWLVVFKHHDESPIRALTAPLAICLAALKALEAK